MSCALSASRGADLAYAYRFPASLDLSSYSAQMVIYAERGGAVLLTVSETPTVNGSYLEFDGQRLEIHIESDDIDALPENDDTTLPSLLQYDVFLTTVDLTEKLAGGLFKAMPFGSEPARLSGAVDVAVGGDDISVELVGVRGANGAGTPVSSFMEPVLVVSDEAGARSALGAVAKIGDTMTGPLGLVGATMAGAPPITATFLGDGNSAKFGVNLVLTGTSSTTNEIGSSVVIDNPVAAGGGKLFSVALFAGHVSRAGSCLAYAMNTVLTAYGVVPGTSAEHNTNNIGSDRGNADNENSIFTYNDHLTGVNIVIGTTQKIMAGLVITAAPAVGQALNRGLLIDGNCVAKNAIEDTSNAPTAYKSSGTKGVGFDLTGTTFTTNNAMKLGNDQCLTWRTAGVDRQFLAVAGTEGFIGSGTTAVNLAQATRYSTDNTFPFGDDTHRATVIWATTGSINVSDRRRKTDFRPLPGSALNFVCDIASHVEQFRWKDGGKEAVEYFEEVPVQARDEEGNDLWEEIPEFNDDGSPLMITPVHYRTGNPLPDLQTGKPYVDGAGRPIIGPDGEPVIDPSTCDPLPAYHKVSRQPIMTTELQPRVRYEPRPGVRNHVSLIIDEEMIAKVVAYFGEETFGGLVRGQDGYWNLRPDQWSMLTLVAVAEARAESQGALAAMAARLDALESA